MYFKKGKIYFHGHPTSFCSTSADPSFTKICLWIIFLYSLKIGKICKTPYVLIHDNICWHAFKGLSHENLGVFCYISIESFFHGLLSPMIPNFQRHLDFNGIWNFMDMKKQPHLESSRQSGIENLFILWIFFCWLCKCPCNKGKNFIKGEKSFPLKYTNSHLRSRETVPLNKYSIHFPPVQTILNPKHLQANIKFALYNIHLCVYAMHTHLS